MDLFHKLQCSAHAAKNVSKIQTHLKMFWRKEKNPFGRLVQKTQLNPYLAKGHNSMGGELNVGAKNREIDCMVWDTTHYLLQSMNRVAYQRCRHIFGTLLPSRGPQGNFFPRPRTKPLLCIIEQSRGETEVVRFFSRPFRERYDKLLEFFTSFESDLSLARGKRAMYISFRR